MLLLICFVVPGIEHCIFVSLIQYISRFNCIAFAIVCHNFANALCFFFKLLFCYPTLSGLLSVYFFFQVGFNPANGQRLILSAFIDFPYNSLQFCYFSSDPYPGCLYKRKKNNSVHVNFKCYKIQKEKLFIIKCHEESSADCVCIHRRVILITIEIDDDIESRKKLIRSVENEAESNSQ